MITICTPSGFLFFSFTFINEVITILLARLSQVWRGLRAHQVVPSLFWNFRFIKIILWALQLLNFPLPHPTKDPRRLKYYIRDKEMSYQWPVYKNYGHISLWVGRKFFVSWKWSIVFFGIFGWPFYQQDLKTLFVFGKRV